jgi:hypothetical protein
MCQFLVHPVQGYFSLCEGRPFLVVPILKRLELVLPTTELSRASVRGHNRSGPGGPRSGCIPAAHRAMADARGLPLLCRGHACWGGLGWRGAWLGGGQRCNCGGASFWLFGHLGEGQQVILVLSSLWWWSSG